MDEKFPTLKAIPTDYNNDGNKKSLYVDEILNILLYELPSIILRSPFLNCCEKLIELKALFIENIHFIIFSLIINLGLSLMEIN